MINFISNFRFLVCIPSKQHLNYPTFVVLHTQSVYNWGQVYRKILVRNNIIVSSQYEKVCHTSLTPHPTLITVVNILGFCRSKHFFSTPSTIHTSNNVMDSFTLV